MKKSKRVSPKRSIKGFFIAQVIIVLTLLYIINNNVPQENHIDNVANIIVHPREHIQQAVEHSTKTVLYTRQELFCLAQNIFFEARGADIDEKIRVANVTLNRVKSDRYSDNVCEVVYEPFQFSWTLKKHNLKSIIYSNKKERKAWEDSVKVAEAQLSEDLPDLTNGSMFYHTHTISPKWAKSFKRTVSSQWHQYYKM